MGNEHGKEHRSGMTYRPEGAEASACALELRSELKKRLGGRDYVNRYCVGGGRARITLPYGEELLRRTQLELLGLFRGMHHVRAWVDIPCSPPEGTLFVSNDPFRDMVEFYVPEHANSEKIPDRPLPIDQRRSAISNHSRQAIAIVMMLAAFGVGTFVGQHLDFMRKRFHECCNFIDAKTQQTPPVQPQESIPADSI